MNTAFSHAPAAREPAPAEALARPADGRILLLQLESILGRIGLLTVAVALAAMVLVAFLIAINVITENEGAIGWALLPFFTIAHAMALTIGLLLPGAVWAGLPPGRRAVFHAHPIDRSRHELLRIAAGVGLLLASIVVLDVIALLLHFRLLPPATPLPPLRIFVLGIVSPVIAYLLVSLGGLLTRSALGNLMRVGVYGLLGSMGASILGQRYAWVSSLAKWVQGTVIDGPWGLGSALLAGVRSPGVASPESIFSRAGGFWLGVAILAVWGAAGRLPRNGRG